MESETQKSKPQKIQVIQHSFAGGLWLAAWLFTVGFLHLTFWRGVWALIIWPYYMGIHFSPMNR